MTNCKHCDKPITKSSPGVQCHGQCAAHFHANSTCSDVSKSQISTLESLPGARWMCKPCRGQRARTTSINLEEINETQVIDFMRKMKTELRAEMKDLKRAVDFCSDKISDFESKLAKLNEYIKKTDQLQKENIKLKQDINSLESKMSLLESFLRCNNVEIQDVPEKTNESLLSVVQDIGKFLQYEIKESAIDTVFRVQTQVFTEWKSHTRRKLKFNRPLNDVEKQLVELTGITGNPERKKTFNKELKNKNVSSNDGVKQEDPEIKEEIEDESDSSFIETEKKPVGRTVETHVRGNRKIIISEKPPKTKVPDKPVENKSKDQSKAEENQFKPGPPSTTVINDPNLRPRVSDVSTQIDFQGISTSDIASVGAALLSLSNAVNRYCDIVERRIF